MHLTDELSRDEAFARAMARARAYLQAPTAPSLVLPALGAAAFFAFCSILFATVAITSPALTLDPAPKATPGAFGPPLAGAVD
jgi:hypothetical protein